MKDFFKKQRRIVSRGFKDIKAFFDFRKTVKSEMLDDTSRFNALGLGTNKMRSLITKVIEIPEDYEKKGDSIQKKFYLRDVVKPINTYIERGINWGEYLLLKFYHFEDAENPDNVVTTYIAAWEFSPICLNRFVFWRNLIVVLAIIAGAAYGCLKAYAVFF